MTTCWRPAWSSSLTPPSHGYHSDDKDLSDGRSSGEKTTLRPFVEFHNRVNSYNVSAGWDDKQGEDGLGAARIEYLSASSSVEAVDDDLSVTDLELVSNVAIAWRL